MLYACMDERRPTGQPPARHECVYAYASFVFAVTSVALALNPESKFGLGKASGGAFGADRGPEYGTIVHLIMTAFNELTTALFKSHSKSEYRL